MTKNKTIKKETRTKNKIIEPLPSYSYLEKNATIIKEDELNINDKIYIDFTCLSQKYELEPKYGKIILLDKNNILNTKIKNRFGKIESLLHPYVSYYGDTPGYWFTIYLLN